MARTAGLLLALAACAAAFAPAGHRVSPPRPVATSGKTNTEFELETGMRAFQWNYNIGRSPWGFGLNAEVWNCRVSMMAFVWVVVQETVTGKGTITAFLEATTMDELFVPILNAAAFALITLGLTAVIATNDNDKYFSAEGVLSDLEEL
ncbi:hypothetical protein M885DRAFT_522667 [Pelagophyceae sp. CCMP2097]|nr:hypothetical protein M885DRAFT_522667 [Pelagophyceae sp. CCMP2097]